VKLEDHLDPALVKALKLVTRLPEETDQELINLEYLAKAQERISEHNLKLAEGWKNVCTVHSTTATGDIR
jgi:hypothetical protein